MTQLAKTFDRIEVVSLPLKTRFRGLQSRELLLFRGQRWAEFCPFSEYPDSEAKAWLAAAIEWASGSVPEPKRTRVPINATLPAVPIEDVENVLTTFGEFRTVKIKVAEAGQDSATDIARINRVTELFPDVNIRLDANGAWSISAAIEFARAILETGCKIQYFEQPVATIDELSQLREKFHNLELGIAIAADESIRRVTDPLEVIRKQAADILILKNSPLGGIEKSLEIVNASDLDVVISSALESSIGLQSGLHLAASLEKLELDCGLGTAVLFEEDIVTEPLLPINGYIELREVEPDEALIKKYSVPKERKDFWLERLERVLELL